MKFQKHSPKGMERKSKDLYFQLNLERQTATTSQCSPRSRKETDSLVEIYISESYQLINHLPRSILHHL